MTIDAREETSPDAMQAPAEKPKQITISGVLECLDNGMDRKKIREYYGITNSELQQLFQHPKLKNKKPRKTKKLSFTIVDDTEEEVEGTVPEAIKDYVVEAETKAETTDSSIESEDDTVEQDDQVNY